MKAKIFFLLFCFNLFFFCFSFAQATDWVWAKSGRGTNGDEGMGVCTDHSGNVFITGRFKSPTITFGNFVLTNTSSLEDVYVVKYNSSGNVIWAKSAGSADFDEGTSICADDSGNIIVTGVFYGSSISFGNFTLTNFAFGAFDIFTVKYDPVGNVIWAKSAGGNNMDWANSVCADDSGNVLVTGYFNSASIAFGNDTLTQSNNGSSKYFIVKYDLSGNELWAKTATGSNDVEGYAVSVDGAGNVFVTGNFQGSSVSFGSITLSSSGLNDIFILKYDPAGNLTWAKSVGGASVELSYSICTDKNGNTFVAGYFSSSSITFGTVTLTLQQGSMNAFVAKYDNSGNVLWAKSAWGNSGQEIYSVSSDTSGNIYVAGFFSSTILDFGTATVVAPPANCSPNNCDPLFVAKYDLNGNILCADALSSGGDDLCGISADRFGNAYLSGDFMAHTFIVGHDTLIPQGEENIFVAKYNCKGTEGIFGFDEQNGIEIFPNPSNGIFTVKIENGKIENAEVYNMLGEIVNKNFESNSQMQIDLTTQANGIYFLFIKTEKGVETRKIMIQR
jgi:hypothetical protein